MQEVGLPEAVASMLAKGYVSEVSFRRAFRSEESLDHFIEELLNRGQPCGVLDIGAWEVHPVAGMLREIWEPVVVPAEEGRRELDRGLGAFPFGSECGQ